MKTGRLLPVLLAYAQWFFRALDIQVAVKIVPSSWFANIHVDALSLEH